MSPRKRPNGYYQWRKRLPDVGYVSRSLRTKAKRTAERRATAIETLIKRDHLALVVAWVEGRIELAELVEAYESGRTDRLYRRLDRSAVPSLAVACEAALADKAVDVRPATLERYRTGLAHYRAHHGDDARVPDVLTDAAVQAFKRARLGAVTRGTVNKDLQAVSVLVTHAAQEGWVRKRPTIKKLRVDPKTIALTDAERDRYMMHLRKAFRPVMAFLLETGCRLGEAERLRVGDVNLAARECEIRTSKTASGVRMVPLSKAVVDVLAPLVEDRGPDERVFAPIPRRTVQKEHTDAAKEAGLPAGYTIHRHRDTFAVTVARRGIPITTLSGILGHKTIQQTMKYARYNPTYHDAAPYLDGEKVDPSGTFSGPVASGAPEPVKKP